TAKAAFHFPFMRTEILSGISTGFPELSQAYRQVTHVILTHPPLIPQTSTRRFQSASCARLACIRHTASVRPEPRSNSPYKMVCFMFSSPIQTLRFKIKILTRFIHVECINVRVYLLDIYCLLSFQRAYMSYGNDNKNKYTIDKKT